MYAFVDRPVLSLDHGGRFLVWSVRQWVKAMAEGRCAAAAVGPAFAKWQVMGALAPFHRMLALLNMHGLHNFAVAPAECRHVTEDEAIFLALIHGLEQSQPALVQGTIAMMVEEEHVPAMMDAVTTLGRTLAIMGFLPGEPAAPPIDSTARRTR